MTGKKDKNAGSTDAADLGGLEPLGASHTPPHSRRDQREERTLYFVYREALACSLFSNDKTCKLVEKGREVKQNCGRLRVCVFVNSESVGTNSKSDLLETLNKDILLEDRAKQLYDLYRIQVLR